MNKIAIVGLGYVGLPLSIEFSKYFEVVGYDINLNRINQLKNKIDKNKEISKNELKNSKKLFFTNKKKDIKKCNIFIITVPTPINKFNLPDLRLIKSATNLVSEFINKGDYIVFESTFYPGLTDDILIPIIENKTGLKINKDFYCGYSPERINPGDKKRKLKHIKKIVSGSNKHALSFVTKLYQKIIKAGIHKASSIKIAEAAKVIENCQRDINIAFVNELTIIFDKMNLNTNEILKAASTKWNFLNFKPGLVGGHCIGVDPYYLTNQAKKYGYNSKIILSGRSLNNNMGKYIANKLKKEMKLNKFKIKKSKLLIMGFTFKENCSDIRNTKIADVVKITSKYFKNVDIYDPMADYNEVKEIYKMKLLSKPKINYYDSIIILVNHNIFIKTGLKSILKYAKKNSLIYDFKNIFNIEKNFFLKNEITIR